MILEIVVCALAAAAILTLLWWLTAQFLLPIRTTGVCLLLPGQGDGGTLELDCRAYVLLKNAGAFRCPLLIVDEGLSEEGRRLAAQLTRLDDGIVLCQPEELLSLL